MTSRISPAFMKGLEEDDVVDLVQQLVRIPSVNQSLAEEEGTNEGAVATFARDWLRARGVNAWLEEAAPGRPNCVAEVGSRGSPTLVFCAHLDTVSAAGMTIPAFDGNVQDDRIYGRGTYDMKGSAAAIMAAAVSLSAMELPGRLLLALVADEEYASVGASDFVRRHPADACIVTEPSEGQLILGHKGFVWADIVTTGRAAHGSRWDLGRSAIADMAPIVTALEAWDRDVLRRRVDPLVGPASMHCAMVSGGSGLSTYASECTIKIERRTLPGETVADVEHELHELVKKTGKQASIRCFFDRPPLRCDREAPVVAALRAAIAAISGGDPVEAGVSYWMDAAIFAAAGIPTANYGPSGAGAHEAVEWVSAASVLRCWHVLVDAAKRFCATPSGGRPDMPPLVSS